MCPSLQLSLIISSLGLNFSKHIEQDSASMCDCSSTIILFLKNIPLRRRLNLSSPNLCLREIVAGAPVSDYEGFY